MLFESLTLFGLAPLITGFICGTSVVLHVLCVVVVITFVGCGKKKPKTENGNNPNPPIGTTSVSPGNVDMSTTKSGGHTGIKANAPLAVTNAPNSPTVDLTFDDAGGNQTQGVPVDPPTNTDEKAPTPAKTPPTVPEAVSPAVGIKPESLAPTQASSAAATEHKGKGKGARAKQEPSAPTKKDLTLAATQPSDAP
uniref:DUF4150 domain-containing protein n=1 Tax=Panagrellus redivivus TaxID=6233 RepID=A0A7E4WCY4_PANRE